jgi:hypothetical protein
MHPKAKLLLRNYHFQMVVAIFIADGLFFSLTKPSTASSLVLIAGFGLLVLTSYLITRFVFGLVSLFVPVIAKQKHIEVVVSAIFGVLVALQSLGQLSLRDFIVVVVFAGFIYLYGSYTKWRFLS